MRTDRPRFDKSTTGKLLEFEERLALLDCGAPPDESLSKVLDDLAAELQQRNSIRTSRELAYVLQVAMMIVVSQIRSLSSHPDETRFLATCTLFDRQDSVLVVKPCSFGPGKCSAWQSTIELPLEGRPRRSRIGLSGAAFLSGRVIYCPDLRGRNCPVQIAPEQTHSVTAFCVPLQNSLLETLDAFCTAEEDTYCCGSLAISECMPRNAMPRAVASLSIEATTQALDRITVRRVLQDLRIRETLSLVYDALIDYLQERPRYELLRNCTSLFQLSQHNLESRAAYEALLREISEVCDGADVTLHLRDLFRQSDADRCLRLVAGTGPRFREFLINERYGRGLVGEALSQERIGLRTTPEIRIAAAENIGDRYHRLMPDTALNFAVPVWFFSRVIAVINVEWGRSSLRNIGNSKRAQEAYVRSKEKVLQRMAAYLAQVIDYYDDLRNEGLEHQGDFEKHAGGIMARLQTMAYYVGNTMASVDREVSGEGAARNSEEKLLQQIIDAVGYLVTFEHNLRVLVSVRTVAPGDRGEQKLRLDCEHGFRTTDESGKNRSPIPVRFGESVLASCAELGVPIFGEVLEGAWLRPATLCRNLVPESDRAQLDQDLVYRPAGNNPVYEVAVPLVFGREVIGTFDFELFSLEDKASLPGGGREWRGHEVAPFLEWARAITFCLMYAKDRKRSLDAGSPYGSEAFHRFQRFCSQIIANVPVPGLMLGSLARKYFQSLLPVEDIRPLLPTELRRGGDSRRDEEASEASRRRLWYRGRYVGEIEIIPDRESPQPEISRSPGGTKLVEQLIDAFYTATLSASEKEIPDTREFKARLRSVEQGVRGQVDGLRKQEALTPANFLVGCFEALQTELLRALAPEAGVSKHGWFLYLVRSESGPGGKRTFLRCGSPQDGRWAFMRTREMFDLVDRIWDGTEPQPPENLRKVLVKARKEHLFENWAETSGTESLGTPRIEKILYEALVEKDYEYPRDRHLEETSLTLRTVLRKETISFVDLNSAAYRSPRNTGWFFGNAPYSIICLPIVLHERCIGILHLLRRRDAIDDFAFFKNDEILAARHLCEGFTQLLAEELKLFRVKLDSETRESPAFSLQIQALGAHLRGALAHFRAGLLECDFAADEGLIEKFCEIYVGNEEEVFVLSTLDEDLWKSKPEHDGKIIAISFSVPDHPESLLPPEVERGILRLAHYNQLIIFCGDKKSKEVLGKLPIHLGYYNQVQKEDPENVLRLAVASTGALYFPDLEHLGIILRQTGSWSYGRMLNHCGPTEHDIRNRVPEMLRQLKDDGDEELHFFPDWIGYRAWFEEG